MIVSASVIQYRLMRKICHSGKYTAGLLCFCKVSIVSSTATRGREFPNVSDGIILEYKPLTNHPAFFFIAKIIF